MNTELDPNKLEQLKEIYVDAKVNQMSYETLIDYVKTDFYQNVDKYKTLNQKLYGYSLADDIIYDFDKNTLQEWLLKL
tara:strand:+ start:55 stop:288 length:234 start_codon:yes stop_codon:yes gene_type:complete